MTWTGTAVIPSSFTTNRQDVHALVIAIADAWITYALANGIVKGLVRKRWHTLPEDLSGEGPAVYLSEITERITHDMQTRTTVFEGAVAYFDVLSDPQETDDRVNAFADYMRDTFTANAQTLPYGMFEQYQAGEEPPLHEGTTPFAHFVIRWRFTVQGGYR
jgi:hypothetical protein